MNCKIVKCLFSYWMHSLGYKSHNQDNWQSNENFTSLVGSSKPLLGIKLSRSRLSFIFARLDKSPSLRVTCKSEQSQILHILYASTRNLVENIYQRIHLSIPYDSSDIPKNINYSCFQTIDREKGFKILLNVLNFQHNL